MSFLALPLQKILNRIEIKMAITLFINSQCQLNCRYCFGWEEKDSTGRRLSLDKILNIAEIMWKRGHRYITITGGEPFLHPQIREIITALHEKGFWLSILTNGIAIDDDLARFLAGFWRCRIRVSLEGAKAEIHDYFRGKGNFERAVRGIDALVRNHAQVGIGLTIYDENRDQVDPVVNFCLDHGCTSLRVVPVVRIEKGLAAKVSVDLYEGVLTSLLSSALQHKSRLRLDQSLQLPDFPVSVYTTQRCFAGEGFLGITADGTVMPCSLIRFGEGVPFGAIDNEDDLDRIKEKMDFLFADIDRHQTGKCSECEYKVQCVGGCPGEKLSFGVTFYDEQPVCLKDIMKVVVAKFNASDIKPIIDYWISQMNSSLEDVKKGGCMRQSPFWKLEFKGR